MEKIRQLWPHQEASLKGLSPSLIDRFKSYKSLWWDKEFPRGQEFWKYVKFNKLSEKTWRLPEDNSLTNGVAFSRNSPQQIHLHNLNISAEWEREGLAPDGLEVFSVQEVLQNSKLYDEYSQYLFNPSEGSLFESLNASFFTNGFLVRVSNSKSMQDIRVHLKATGENEFINTRVVVIVEQSCQAQIFFDIELSGTQFLNLSKDFHLAENANLKIYSKEKGSESSYVLGSDNLHLKKSAHCHFYDMTLPSQWTRHNLVSNLENEGAEVRLVGSYLNERDYFCDHHTIINHMKPSTFSHQNYKGILTGTSKAVFNGRIYIAPGASKSHSEQLNKNLLLSEKAEINTKPELQIYNDDVKAAHGATIGQLDNEQLFYLQSRGIKKDIAWQLLSEAFVYDLFEDLAEDEKSFFMNALEETLTHFQGDQDGL